MRLVETTRSNIISYAIHNMVETISNSSPPDLTDQKAIAVASEAIPQSSRGLRPSQTPFLLLQTPFQHPESSKLLTRSWTLGLPFPDGIAIGAGGVDFAVDVVETGESSGKRRAMAFERSASGGLRGG